MILGGYKNSEHRWELLPAKQPPYILNTPHTLNTYPQLTALQSRLIQYHGDPGRVKPVLELEVGTVIPLFAILCSASFNGHSYLSY